MTGGLGSDCAAQVTACYSLVRGQVGLEEGGRGPRGLCSSPVGCGRRGIETETAIRPEHPRPQNPINDSSLPGGRWCSSLPHACLPAT